MIFRIIIFLFFLLFFYLGLNRLEYTDDEKTYLAILNYNSENIRDFTLHALSYSSNISHLILMKISGSYFNLIKFFFLFSSWILLDKEFKHKGLQFRKLFPFFLFPYFFISGTLLRDDLIVAIVLLIVYVSLKYENKVKYIYFLILLTVLFYTRFYWALIILASIIFLNFKTNKKWLVIFIPPLTYVLFNYGNQFSEFINVNFNILKFLYSPIPWKISSGVGIYESIPAYWLLFTLKLLLTFALFSKKVRIKIWNLFYLSLPILIFQNITVLNGPRQTTIFIGLFLCSLMTQKNKYV